MTELMEALAGVQGTSEQPEETKQQPQEATQEQQPVVEQPALDWDKVIAEKTGGKYNTFDEFLKINEDKPYEFKNETSKKVYELLKEGKVTDVADILNKQALAYSSENMSDEESIKTRLSLENPEWSAQEVDDEFNSRFKADEADVDMMNEDEKKSYEKNLKKIERELKKEAKASREFLASQKEEIAIPDKIVDEQGIIAKYLLSQQSQQEALQKQYLESVDSGVEALAEFATTYKDDEVSFDGKFAITPEDKEAIKQSLKNPKDNPFLNGNRYFKDGKYDTAKMAEDQYLLENRDKIINSIVTQAVSKTKAAFLMKMKNTDFSDSARGTYQPSKDEAYVKAASAILDL